VRTGNGPDCRGRRTADIRGAVWEADVSWHAPPVRRTCRPSPSRRSWPSAKIGCWKGSETGRRRDDGPSAGPRPFSSGSIWWGPSHRSGGASRCRAR
jgi:hypothetical protein